MLLRDKFAFLGLPGPTCDAAAIRAACERRREAGEGGEELERVCEDLVRFAEENQYMARLPGLLARHREALAATQGGLAPVFRGRK